MVLTYQRHRHPRYKWSALEQCHLTVIQDDVSDSKAVVHDRKRNTITVPSECVTCPCHLTVTTQCNICVFHFTVPSANMTVQSTVIWLKHQYVCLTVSTDCAVCLLSKCINLPYHQTVLFDCVFCHQTVPSDIGSWKWQPMGTESGILSGIQWDINYTITRPTDSRGPLSLLARRLPPRSSIRATEISAIRGRDSTWVHSKPKPGLSFCLLFSLLMRGVPASLQ